MAKTKIVKDGNRIEQINNSKYRVFINDKTYNVYFSLGLKRELFKIISEAYIKTLDVFNDSSKEEKLDLMNEAKKIAGLEGKEKEKAVEEMTTKLVGESAHNTIKRDLSLLQDYEEISYKIISIMLTQRDSEGNPVDEITVNNILYSPDFENSDDVLSELYELALEKYEDTAKKNSQMMTKTLNPLTGNKKTSSA